MSASARDALTDYLYDAFNDPPHGWSRIDCATEARDILTALSAAGFVIVPRDGMKVPHDAAAAFWRRFQELHHAETGARGFYESFGGGWNAMIAMLSAAEGKK